MIEIIDKEFLEELTEKLIETEFKDSIEKGEITEKEARDFIKKYIRFSIHPVVKTIYGKDSKYPEVSCEVIVNFNKAYYDLFGGFGDKICGHCVYYNMDEYCSYQDNYFPEYHSCNNWEKAE